MRSIETENAKAYLNGLFTEERYDSFYLYEARIKAGLDYYISGKKNSAYYADAEENSEDGETEYILWKEIKQTVLSLMKGDRLPISVKLIFMFHRDNIKRLCEMNNLPVNENEIGGLFMNLSYEQEKLTITTGTSLKVFTMDKTLEQLWDATVEKFYA